MYRTYGTQFGGHASSPKLKLGATKYSVSNDTFSSQIILLLQKTITQLTDFYGIKFKFTQNNVIFCID